MTAAIRDGNSVGCDSGNAPTTERLVARREPRQFVGVDEREREQIEIGIVAVARRLMIALWGYVETGRAPEGAQLKA